MTLREQALFDFVRNFESDATRNSASGSHFATDNTTNMLSLWRAGRLQSIHVHLCDFSIIHCNVRAKCRSVM